MMNEIASRGEAFVYDAPFTPREMEAYLAGFPAQFVAEVDGRIVGGYVLRPNLPGRGAHIANAAYMVAGSARGLGVGRRLGEHSLVEAKLRGFTALQFNAVVASNAPAVTLWKRLGFQIIGTVPRGFHHADGQFHDLHIMHRSL